MLKDIRAYILKCEPCLRCKYETLAQPGLIQPLPIPNGVWHNVAMNFIERLPKSGRKDNICVIIDRMRKYAHFLALAHPIIAVTVTS